MLNVGTPGEWDDYGVSNPSVIYDVVNDVYRMWYTGFDGVRYAIGYAESPDGFHWTKFIGNPILAPVIDSWENANVMYPTVLKVRGLYWMWYTGTQVGADPNPRIGCAVSSDGKLWIRDANNPVVSRGTATAPPYNFDHFAVASPTVIPFQDRRTLIMLYTGYSSSTGGTYGIGYADCNFGVGSLPLFAPHDLTNSVITTYFINADPSRSQYTAYDSLSAGILYGLQPAIVNHYMGFDTDTGWVTQTGPDKGKLLLNSKWVVTMGGPSVNSIVGYYEKTTAVTPVYFHYDSTANLYEFVDRSTKMVKASISTTADFNHEDYAVIVPLYQDGNQIVYRKKIEQATNRLRPMREHMRNIVFSTYNYRGPTGNTFVVVAQIRRKHGTYHQDI